SLTLFFLTHPPAADISTLSLHDALPILAVHDERQGILWRRGEGARSDRAAARLSDAEPLASPAHASAGRGDVPVGGEQDRRIRRSEEHTSELQSQSNLVCRLLLEKKK